MVADSQNPTGHGPENARGSAADPPAASAEESAADRAVPLCDLRPGERATVCAAHLCPSDCELLRAMGMSEQCRLRVCRAGEPCIVQVSTTRLGLSRRMTRHIMVQRDAADG